MMIALLMKKSIARKYCPFWKVYLNFITPKPQLSMQLPPRDANER